jgi:hypothetical protein
MRGIPWIAETLLISLWLYCIYISCPKHFGTNFGSLEGKVYQSESVVNVRSAGYDAVMTGFSRSVLCSRPSSSRPPYWLKTEVLKSSETSGIIDSSTLRNVLQSLTLQQKRLRVLQNSRGPIALLRFSAHITTPKFGLTSDQEYSTIDAYTHLCTRGLT